MILKIKYKLKQTIKNLIFLLGYFPFKDNFIDPPKGYYLTSKEYYEKFSEVLGSNQIIYKTHLPSSVIRRTPPNSIYEEIHWKFKTSYVHESPETFTISIPKGQVFSSNCSVITPNNKLILDVSLEFGIGRNEEKVNLHPVFQYFKLPKYESIPKTVAVLATAGSSVYYHWLTDALPRIQILRACLQQEFDKINKFVVPKGLPVIQESLAMLGISSQDLIFTDWKLHLQAEHLIVPSLPGNTGNTPTWVIDFLRNSFLDKKTSNHLGKRIYVSRSKARYRKIINENEVLNCLKNFDFKPVWLEDHDFATQIAIFSDAELIVAPHGAGLTNLVWCNPSTKVLEIFSPNYVNVCYWAMANQVGIEYFYLIGDGKKPPEYIDPHLVGDNINVSVKDLYQTLEMMIG